MLKNFLLIIYEFIHFFLFFFLIFTSYFIPNKKLKHFLKLRSPKNFFQDIHKACEYYNNVILSNHIKNSNYKPQIFWFHVSSAGEMEQAIPVARQLHNNLGAYFFVTYYSFSAEPFLKNFPATIGFTGLPLDIRFIYKNLLNILPITKIFFVRYDIWPSLLLTCKEKNLEINLLSATKIKTRKGIRAYVSKKWNNLFYKYFSNIFAVSIEDLNYFKNVVSEGLVYLAGDAKWARANERAHSLTKTNEDPYFFTFIHFFKKMQEAHDRKILVIASPHSKEHELVLKISILNKKLFLIYVPHEVDTKTIQSLFINLQSSGYKPVLYSQLEKNKLLPTENIDLVIIDKIGFLSEIYQIADAAIIGGGFDGQIHNTLEAAAHGVPTIFGPLYSRAREVTELVQANAALSFENINNMFHFLSTWVNFEESHSLASEERLKTVKQNALQLFQNIPNTSEVIFTALKQKN